MIENRKETMFDYINQTKDVLDSLIDTRKEIFDAFISYYKESPVHQIYIIGSGTSCHAGIATKAFLEELLHVKVIPMFPIPFKDQEKIFDKNTLVIGVSQSGSSMSTILALDKARTLGVRTVVIVGEANKEIEHHADLSIFMDCGVEKAVAKTKGYSSTVLLLMLLGLELAKANQLITEQVYEDYLVTAKKTVANIPSIISHSEQWYHQIEAELLLSERMIVIGYDNQYATVLEGALKLLETVRISVTGYEMEEFMHGIYNSIKENTFLFHIASSGEYQKRIELLHSYMDKTTTYNYMISHADEVDTSKNLAIPFVNDPYFSVLEYIIPFQCLSYLLSLKKGIDPSLPSDPNFHRHMKSKLV